MVKDYQVSMHTAMDACNERFYELSRIKEETDDIALKSSIGRIQKHANVRLDKALNIIKSIEDSDCYELWNDKRKECYKIFSKLLKYMYKL